MLLLEDNREADTVAKLLPIYKEINNLLHKEGFQKISDAFYEADPSLMSGPLLIGALRMTSGWQGKIDSWQFLRDKVTCELFLRGEDVKIRMRGLLDEQN